MASKAQLKQAKEGTRFCVPSIRLEFPSKFALGAQPVPVEALVRYGQRYAEASPVSHVSPDDPPVLLVHGDADTVVPFRQSELFQDRLAKGGVTVELMRVVGGGHGTLAVPGAPDYISATVEWFSTHLAEKD